MPSNFVILSKKIEGYNNILTTATNEMSFGINKDVNYAKPKPKIKVRVEQSNDPNNNSERNNDGGGSGNTFNDSDNVHDNVRSDNKRTKTDRVAGNAQLPMMFFLSLAAGVFVFKKIFS